MHFGYCPSDLAMLMVSLAPLGRLLCREFGEKPISEEISAYSGAVSGSLSLIAPTAVAELSFWLLSLQSRLSDLCFMALCMARCQITTQESSIMEGAKE